jgi:hypothetical protein
MMIQQAFVGARFFQHAFRTKYQLNQYTRTDLPAVFFGCYTTQWKVLQAHQSFAVVIWAGTDAYNLRFNANFCRYLRDNRMRIFHIAISKYIEEDLKVAGLVYRSIPVTPNTYVGLRPCPPGDSVYVYLPDVRSEFYGSLIVEEVKKLIPGIPFIQCDSKTYSRNLLLCKVYPKCFVGLRLTPHDGLSNTVVELGMMGRRSICNAGYPTTIPWTDAESVAQAIIREKEMPPDAEKVSKTFRKWLNAPCDWLNTEFWNKHAEIIARVPESFDDELVTVIINTYNENPKILKQAVESYEKQEGVKMQIIISTVQGDPSMIYGNKHTLICSDKPGIYEQLNNACDFIKGSWFCYASGNDVAMPTKCRDEVRQCYVTNKLVCYADFVITDHNLKAYSSRTFKNYSYKEHLLANYVSDCALINTQLLKNFLPFRSETFGNHAYWDLWLRIYERYGDVFCYLPQKTWLYRQADTSAHIERQKSPEKMKLNIDLRLKLQKEHNLISKNLPLRLRIK